MQETKMTIQQLSRAVQEPIYLQSLQCYRKEKPASPAVKLTDYMRAYTGIMNLEIFALSSVAHCYIVEVDLPPEVLDALSHYATDL